MLADRGYDIGQEHYYSSVEDMQGKVDQKKLEDQALGYNGLDYQYYKRKDTKLETAFDEKISISNKGLEDPENPSFDTNKISVFWRHDEPKIKKTALQTVQIQAVTLKTKRAILIVRDQTAYSRRSTSDDDLINLEVFTLDDLQVNITEHVMVPKHSVLNDEQKFELLSKYRIKESQLPKIRQLDPIARYFGVSKGDVMKIVRPSETAGRYVTYRIVT